MFSVIILPAEPSLCFPNVYLPSQLHAWLEDVFIVVK